jgi:lysophospholipase L1-like esterase
VQREVAAQAGCAFWDWQQATGGPGSMLAWRLHDPPLAAADGIHFSREGYEVSAERLLQAWDALAAE